ncbi:MAG: type I glyceraldehyde-3-phosphate dehydrogenase [Sphingobacteriia bacterium]|nr:type I glyceraldehyde-3-phosphate dehydrogenase [Sphingobacteriia bacterium]
MIRIGINGLGRIGRCIIRAINEYNYKDIEIVAVNGPADINDHAHLIKYDSVHGVFNEEVKVDNDTLIVGRHKMRLTRERDISKLDWAKYGVDIVLECTGKFNKRDEAAKHLDYGAKKVLVSAPCESADSTIVYGVNHDKLLPSHKVVSIGSCTTNCLGPVAKVLHETIGIESGFMTTIHSYTNDQNILDGSHKDLRRARAGAVSMVPTTTGAAKAIGLVIPELAGKLGGSSVRVPTPNVSLVDLCFNASRETTKEEINEILSNAANNYMKGVLAVTNKPLVSIDFNHDSHSSTADLLETYVTNKKFCRVVSWYDNEWGFSVRMLDVTRLLAKGGF